MGEFILAIIAWVVSMVINVMIDGNTKQTEKYPAIFLTIRCMLGPIGTVLILADYFITESGKKNVQ